MTCTREYKIALITRTYLLLQKEPVTAKQIAEFINSNNFTITQSVTSDGVAGVIRKYKHFMGRTSMLRDVEITKGKIYTYSCPKTRRGGCN